MTEKLTGGCLCQAIRYEIDKVFDAGYCHCPICRKLSGAPVLAWANIKTGDFRFIKGVPMEYASSEQGIRCFCPTCGSQLFYKTKASDDVGINLGTLDNPELVSPKIHVFADYQLSWFQLHDSLPRYKDSVIPHPEHRN